MAIRALQIANDAIKLKNGEEMRRKIDIGNLRRKNDTDKYLNENQSPLYFD